MSYTLNYECRKRGFEQGEYKKKLSKPAPLDLSLIDSEEFSGPSTPIITENPFLEDIIKEEILFKDAPIIYLTENDKHTLKIKMLLHAMSIQEIRAPDIPPSILVLKEVSETRILKYID
jgi:hypothetical protein